MRAHDVMTRQIVTIDPSTPVQEIAELLVTRHINGVPVLDDGRLVGIVTTGDLLHRAADERGAARPSMWRETFWRRSGARGPVDQDRAEGRTAAEVMSGRVVTVDREADVVTVARTLLEHRVNAVPVVSGNQVVGIVSRYDVLSYLAAHGGTTNPMEP